MALPRFDQLLPTFSYGDAIGNHALTLRGILRGHGAPSEIFSFMRHPKLQGESREWREYLALDAPGNICLFHFSVGTPLADAFARLRARRVLIYHNITPPEFMRGVNRRAEFECRLGREQLRSLAGRTELGIGVSEFNRRELEEMGFAPTAVVPVMMDFTTHDASPRRELLRRWRDGWTNILHVGRFAPNKRIEDLVKVFHFYKRINPRSRLLLVGTDVNLENYSGAVQELVRGLELPDVHFLGHVDFRDLCTYYRIADLYLVMSEHEGFCVPLLEAMHFGIPVVAYAAAAVPETLGQAGVVVKEKRPEEIAELLHLVITDEDLRGRVVSAGRERVRDFAPERLAADFWSTLRRHAILPD